MIKRNKKVEDCFLRIKKDYSKFLKKEKIFDKSRATRITNLKRIYIPLSFWIDNKFRGKEKTLFFGFSGGARDWKNNRRSDSKNYFKRKIYVSSIDDFYKTLKDRNEMSSAINPLLKTRRVPGTHDVNLIKKFFDFIKKKNLKNLNYQNLINQ